MTQPSFVPIAEADQVRPARRLSLPTAWTPTRPAELRTPAHPGGRNLGRPGPDQGFALSLANRMVSQLHLAPGESAHDAALGCALLASRRAGLYGRAPSIYDVRLAFTIWGFLDNAPADLIEERRQAFSAVSHDYVVQRELVDRVPEATLALTPEEAAERMGEWKQLVGHADADR
jgi:hypothetical protein